MEANELTQLLARVRAEAHRLHDANDLPLLDAYDQAISQIVMVEAEQQAMEPFQSKVVEATRRAQKRKAGRPARRSDVCRELQLMGMSVNAWTVWDTLSTLEARGLLYRPSARLWTAS